MNRALITLVILLLAVGLAGCDKDDKATSEGDAIAQTEAKERLEAARERMTDRRAKRRAERQKNQGNNDQQPMAGGGQAQQNLTPEERTQRRQQRIMHQVWWNDETVVGELALTQTQRQQMDALFAERRFEDHEGINRQAWLEPLKQGDLEAARKAAKASAEEIHRRVLENQTLMIDLFAMLDSTQQQQVLAEHEELLAHPVLRKGKNAGQRRGQREPRNTRKAERQSNKAADSGEG